MILRVPVHTFAEDAALDVGFMLLLAGKEITANPFALLGDVGMSRKLISVQGLLEKLNLKYKQYPTGNIGLCRSGYQLSFQQLQGFQPTR